MTTSRKKVVTEEENKKLLRKLVNEIIFNAHLRYKVSSTEPLSAFFTGSTFNQIVKDITAITGIGNKSKYFFERGINHQTLYIVLYAYSQQFYSMPKTNGNGELEEPKELSELGKEYPYGPFLHRVMTTLLSDLEVLWLFKKEVTKELKAGSYSIKAYKEISEDYLTSNFQEFHSIVSTAKAGSKDSIEDKYVKLDKEKQKQEKRIVISEDKVSNTIFNNFDTIPKTKDETYSALITTKKRGQKNNSNNIGVFVDLSFNELLEEKNISFSNTLSPFDGEVYDAVSSVIRSGKTSFSVTDVASFMAYTSRANKRQRNDIIKSIEKMRTTLFEIDNSSEVDNGYNYPKYFYNATLLPLSKAGKKGEPLEGYYRKNDLDSKITPLYDFSSNRKQILEIDSNLYKIPTIDNMKDENINLKRYLIRRIRENSKKEEFVISLESICKELKITKEFISNKATLRTKENRLIGKIINCLDHWKGGLFKEWTCEKDKGKRTVYRIKNLKKFATF